MVNPEDMENNQYDLQVWAYDQAGNIAKSDVIKFRVVNPEKDSGGISLEILLGMVVVSGFVISTASFRFIRRRRVDKAFDDLEINFQEAEDPGRGKVD